MKHNLTLESAKNLEALDPNMHFGRGGGALGGTNDYDSAASKRGSFLNQSKDEGNGPRQGFAPGKGGNEMKENHWSMAEGNQRQQNQINQR
jgi:hypothetical protein